MGGSVWSKDILGWLENYMAGSSTEQKLQSLVKIWLEWYNKIFVTPKLKFKQQGSQGPGKCWWQCGQIMEDHFHIFWDWPFVQPYWQELAGEILKIFSLNLHFSFVTLYLGRIPVGLMEEDSYLYKALLAASKKAMASDLPAIQGWLDYHQ